MCSGHNNLFFGVVSRYLQLRIRWQTFETKADDVAVPANAVQVALRDFPSYRAAAHQSVANVLKLSGKFFKK